MNKRAPRVGDLLEIIAHNCFAYVGDFYVNRHQTLNPTTRIPCGTIALITSDETRTYRWLNVLANGSQFSIKAWTAKEENNTRYRIIE